MRTIGSGVLVLAGLGTLAAILGGTPAAAAFPKETCFNCHAEHGATDNVFTQFYPILQRGR